ncbi:MAG: hypothetical protein QXR68_07785 [Pyrobaculum sp.]
MWVLELGLKSPRWLFGRDWRWFGWGRVGGFGVGCLNGGVA